MSTIENAKIHEFVKREIGLYSIVKDCSWDHGESKVWQVTTNYPHSVYGKVLYVKNHAGEKGFRQEVGAYSNWLMDLKDITPTLISSSASEPHVVILTPLSGEIAKSVNLSAEEEVDLYYLAGKNLSRLHSVVYTDRNKKTFNQDLERRLHKWIALANGLVDQVVVDWVKMDVMEVVGLQELPRVPCHRDYTPRNWLVGKVGDKLKCGMIDFEHADPSLWLHDFSRLWSEVWPERPDLKDSFLKGYGRELINEDIKILKTLATLDALSTVVWAIQHNDKEFEKHGRQVLSKLYAESNI